MGSKVEYVESSHMYATNYVRNSKAIGVLWGVFSICYAIIVAVAFATPEWLGDHSAPASEHSARFGLYSRCYYRSGGPDGGGDCRGALDELATLPSAAWRAAAVLVALAALLALLGVAAMLLFFFLSATSVFRTCAWLQLLSAACVGAGVAAYPAGWDAPEVRLTCGAAAGRYEPAGCRLGWAFLLAAVGCLDAAVLAALAFILAARHVRLQAEPGPPPGPASLYKGEVNNGFVGDANSLAGSRKSLNLHPVLLMPGSDADRFSEFSGRTAGGRSKSSPYRAEYAPSIHNFQL